METISVSNSSEKLMLSIVSRLRRLLRNVLRITKLLSVMNSTYMPEPFHNFHSRRMLRRQQRTEESNQRRRHQRYSQRWERNLHLGQEKAHGRMFHDGQQQPSKSAAKESARDRKRHGLAHKKTKDGLPLEAQSFEQGHLARPFTNRHRHRVGGDQKRGENHSHADAENKRFDVAQHVDEGKPESFLAFGLGGLRRIAKHIVNCAGDFGYIV